MPDTKDTLELIAKILDLPVSSFWGISRSSKIDPSRVHECVELMHGFQQLQDPEARRRCLRFVQMELDKSNGL